MNKNLFELSVKILLRTKFKKEEQAKVALGSAIPITAIMKISSKIQNIYYWSATNSFSQMGSDKQPQNGANSKFREETFVCRKFL